MTPPVFSIVIPCRNAAGTLPQTLESIAKQTESSKEIIVIDGASTDGSAELARNFQPGVDVLISEPDRGVYDAMNKGIRAARGTWILFLGANDKLMTHEVLSEVRRHTNDSRQTVLCGSAEYSDGRKWSAPINPNLRYRNFIHHQSCFYHQSVFAVTKYDANLRYQADYDLNLLLWTQGHKVRPIDTTISVCASGGLSDAGHWANYREEIAVRHRYFSGQIAYYYDALTVARFLRKKLLRSFAKT